MRHSGSGHTEWYLLWKSFSFAPRNQAALDHGRSKATAGVAGNGDVSGRILVFRIVRTMLSLREMGLDPQKDNISIQAIGDSTVIAKALATGIIDGAALDKLQSVRLQGLGVKVLLDLSRIALPSSPYMGAEAFIQKNPHTVENFVKAMIEASIVMRAQK